MMPKEKEKKLVAFIDNEQLNIENWFGKDDLSVKDVMDVFGGWASDAPFMFELEAQKSIGHCLRSKLIKSDEL